MPLVLLQGRIDDNIDTIKKRLKVFESLNLPVIDHYAKRGKLHRVIIIRSNIQLNLGEQTLFRESCNLAFQWKSAIFFNIIIIIFWLLTFKANALQIFYLVSSRLENPQASYLWVWLKLLLDLGFSCMLVVFCIYVIVMQWNFFIYKKVSSWSMSCLFHSGQSITS